MTGVRLTSDVNYTTYIDEVSSSVTYIGKAIPGSSESSAVWQIQNIETAGALVKFLWADGNKNFYNIWSLRASLNYS